MRKILFSMIFIFSILSFSTRVKAEALPFEILAHIHPSAAANGFPFTYTLRVNVQEDLKSLIKRLRLDGEFTDSQGHRILPREGKWSFPYSETAGLFQFLFIIPEDQPGGHYTFRGEVVYQAPNGEETRIPLPISEMEVGGPWLFIYH